MRMERIHNDGTECSISGEVPSLTILIKYGSGTSLLVVRESSPEMAREFADESAPWKNLLILDLF
jgi:hypothetical protein